MNQSLTPTRPHTTDPVRATPATGSRFGRFGRETGYLLSGLPLGVAAFVVAVSGFLLGLGTLIIWVGIPVLVGTLAMARFLAGAEREHVHTATGRPIPRPEYRTGGLMHVIRDPQAWRDLVHAVVALPVRVFSFCVTVTWLAGGIGGLTYLTWSWSLPDGDDQELLVDLMWGIESEAVDIAFHTGAGIFLLLTALPVVRALTTAQAGLARLLLADARR
ncbi:sensor domain-containing protein [Streptomyces marincola]|uniref:sensor domain-containing protein n=1 Tax=Streptomyces marincola TaxID=2878388 RepID=UPI001CF2946F|nr:sensor domain-containing protein [Streptomyces marincola]UCM89161.1 sensor domain-containing protein [Streptomyces marincola]